MKLLTKSSKDRKDLYTFYLSDIYKHYKENYKNPVPWEKFKSVEAKIFKRIIKKIVENSMVYSLPYGLGEIYIVQREYKLKFRKNGSLEAGKNAPIDWLKTKKLWKEDEKAREEKFLVPFDNFHSDNRVFRVKWSKGLKIRNLSIYNFRFSKDNRKYIKRYSKNNTVKYYNY